MTLLDFLSLGVPPQGLGWVYGVQQQEDRKEPLSSGSLQPGAQAQSQLGHQELGGLGQSPFSGSPRCPLCAVGQNSPNRGHPAAGSRTEPGVGWRQLAGCSYPMRRY